MTAVLHQPHGREEQAIENEALNEDSPAAKFESRYEALATKREKRFLQRQSRIKADSRLDPRLRVLFEDRTLWGVNEQIAFLNVTGRARIRVLTRNRQVYRVYDREFPSVLPSPDAFLGDFLRPRPAIEAGRLRQWAWDTHLGIFNPFTGQLVTNPIHRGGRKPKVRGHSFRSTSGGTDVRRAVRGIPKAEHIAQAAAAKAAKTADAKEKASARRTRKKPKES